MNNEIKQNFFIRQDFIAIKTCAKTLLRTCFLYDVKDFEQKIFIDSKSSTLGSPKKCFLYKFSNLTDFNFLFFNFT